MEIGASSLRVVSDYFSGGLAKSIGDGMLRKRLARRGQILLAVRSIDGASNLLSTKWWGGFGRISSGEVEHTRMPIKRVFTRQPPVVIKIWQIDGEVRKRTLVETMWTPENSRVITASTDQGRVELAIQLRSFAWAAEQLGLELPRPPK